MYQAYKYCLDISKEQMARCSSHTGARFVAYNWGIGFFKDRIELFNKKKSEYLDLGYSEKEAIEVTRKEIIVPWTLATLRKEWNQVKDVIAPWWKQNSKEAYNSAFDGLEKALKAWRKGNGFPNYKSRSQFNSVCFTTGTIKIIDSFHVQLPTIGILKTYESTDKLRHLISKNKARILRATLSFYNNKWFVSFGIERDRDIELHQNQDSLCGIDVGVSKKAVIFDGQQTIVIENIKALKRYEKRIANIQQAKKRYSRSQQDSLKTYPPAAFFTCERPSNAVFCGIFVIVFA